MIYNMYELYYRMLVLIKFIIIISIELVYILREYNIFFIGC